MHAHCLQTKSPEGFAWPKSSFRVNSSCLFAVLLPTTLPYCTNTDPMSFLLSDLLFSVTLLPLQACHVFVSRSETPTLSAFRHWGSNSLPHLSSPNRSLVPAPCPAPGAALCHRDVLSCTHSAPPSPFGPICNLGYTGHLPQKTVQEVRERIHANYLEKYPAHI